ncbi:hypothetical protein [Mycolicibacterium sp. XJ870]
MAAAGDFTGAVGSFTPVFIGPFFTAFMQFLNIRNYVEHQFDVAGQVTSVVLNMAWSTGPGQLLGVFQIMGAVAGTLDGLAEAIPEGDPGKAFNAVQHGVANMATAVLGIADTVRWTNEIYIKTIADILNPPPPDPEVLSTRAAITDATTYALQPTATATETPAAVTTPEAEEGAEPEAATTELEATEPAKEIAKPLVRESFMAIPGKGGLDSGTNDRSARLVSALSEGITDTVGKIDDGIKKAFAKPVKKTSAESDGDSTDSAGSSGDTE